MLPLHLARLSLLVFAACASEPPVVTSEVAEEAARSACSAYTIDPALPRVYDCTPRHPDPRVPALVRRAVDGLGFRGTEGPRAGDLIFVGEYYAAWIDRTGYFGKLNALWPLDPATLEPTLAEPVLHGPSRPVNLLLPGEDGDGSWPRAYNGGEHYEMPRYQGGVNVAQAGLREANHFGDAPDSWRQCINANTSPSRWTTILGSNTTTIQTDGTLRVMNRAPLAIVARFTDAAYACGSAFPFNDEQPGTMELSSGYVLYPHAPTIDRLYQLANASTHDYVAQTAVDKLIGGLLLTDWPEPHYLKQFQRWRSWDGAAFERFSPFPHDGQGQRQDLIDVHGAGTLWLSAASTPASGRSIGIEQAGGLGDVGTCLCAVHGGIEFGGSVLANLSLPHAQQSPTRSAIHKRTLHLGTAPVPSSQNTVSYVLEAEEQNPIIHEVGFFDGVFWSALTGPDQRDGFLYYRRYLPVDGGAVGQVAFTLGIDIVNAVDEPVVTIDIVHDGVDVLTSRAIRRSEFRADNTSQRFVLDFQSPRSGVIEPRVRWHNKALTRLDGIVVNWVPPDRETHVLEAEAAGAGHQTGKLEGPFWGANVDEHATGLLYFGPRVEVGPYTAVTARSELFIDVVSGPGVDTTAPIVRLELLAHRADDSSFIAAERVLRRYEFPGPDQIASFDLTLPPSARSAPSEVLWVEPRLYYFRNAYTRLDRTTVLVTHP